MGSRAGALRDEYGDAPWVDWVVLCLGLGVWWFDGHGWFPPGETTRAAFYTATGALAGIVLAAATFACTQVFQATTGILPRVRDENPEDYRAGAVGLLSSLLLAAFLPIGSVLLDSLSAQWAFGLGLSAAMLMGLRFLRVVAWFDLGLRGASTPDPPGQRGARATPEIRQD